MHYNNIIINITINTSEEGASQGLQICRAARLARSLYSEAETWVGNIEGPQLTLSSCDVGCVAQWSRINFHL